MKLIYCLMCGDIVRLTGRRKTCACGRASGQYIGEVMAVYRGTAVPLGIEGEAFYRAVRRQPMHDTGKGLEFKAFVIAMDCKTFQKED